MHILKTRILLRILALILVALLARVAFQPPPGRPNVSVKFLGYTNDAAGTRLAMIAVTNLSAFKIFVYRPTIEMLAPTEPRGFTNYFQGDTNQWQRFHSMLGKGASGNFTIPPPTNQLPWRLSFYVYNDFGAAQVIKRIVAGRHMPFEIEGDWIDSKQ